MLYYDEKLTSNARALRKHSTRAEIVLWSCLKRKQLLNVQFYRQKPIGNYIVDFYAPAAKLVIEIDGAQHAEMEFMEKDKVRDAFMQRLGLRVLRFDNSQVLRSLGAVKEVIYFALEEPLSSLFRRGA